MDRRYSTLMVLAIAALFAEACSSSGGGGTGGAGGGGGSSSVGGATGSGGAGAGGRAGASGTGGATATGGMTGTGGKVDSGTDMTTSSGGMTGTGGKVDSGTDSPIDTPVVTDSGVDADPAAPEKALCATQAYMSTSAPPFSAVEFCTLYREICNNIVGATNFATEAACEAAYNGYNTDASASEGPNGQKGCRTYHLCNANQISLTQHCPHATGFGNNDAAGGPCP